MEVSSPYTTSRGIRPRLLPSPRAEDHRYLDCPPLGRCSVAACAISARRSPGPNHRGMGARVSREISGMTQVSRFSAIRSGLPHNHLPRHRLSLLFHFRAAKITDIPTAFHLKVAPPAHRQSISPSDPPITSCRKIGERVSRETLWDFRRKQIGNNVG